MRLTSVSLDACAKLASRYTLSRAVEAHRERHIQGWLPAAQGIVGAVGLGNFANDCFMLWHRRHGFASLLP